MKIDIDATLDAIEKRIASCRNTRTDAKRLLAALREALPGVYSSDTVTGKNRAERILRILKEEK